jgi:hypothetical protein
MCNIVVQFSNTDHPVKPTGFRWIANAIRMEERRKIYTLYAFDGEVIPRTSRL